MIIEFKATDNDNITTEAEFNSDFTYEQDYADLINLLFKFLLKSGVDVPSEITDELEELTRDNE
jgi:hypothetical protein|tara:strand:+ start:6587 stop:6778 length:192 start_codon:yes stop_codon:yes gene_type:complete